uniref:Uncharacterized protein n=1 Tax=Chromera velia CCMP2878 TaxID=1169474 RepID=A0A0G4HH04_9ALVE|eukprot:Cvel_27381.t1-p1 / transcript=Cvel_27381.t1 / gene=Cvel_27381 / organism=Chromera_velia_CCMP2878 / gene_product=hypothetical protein / transcript_product=hypothetical protein / location=Cvel_scaffold3407:7171-8447(-) / protein_length=112 / sequence_SO=supercontig / SO=protein_coding / is_pseudo=false
MKWKNTVCTDKAARLMEDAVREVENALLAEASEAIVQDLRVPEHSHIPTLINNKLYSQCISVAVCPNVGEGCCFRGMNVAQFEVMGKVYNVAVLLRPDLNELGSSGVPARSG